MQAFPPAADLHYGAHVAHLPRATPTCEFLLVHLDWSDAAHVGVGHGDVVGGGGEEGGVAVFAVEGRLFLWGLGVGGGVRNAGGTVGERPVVVERGLGRFAFVGGGC